MGWKGRTYSSLGRQSQEKHSFILWINPGGGLPEPGFFLPLDQDKVEIKVPGTPAVRLQRGGGQTEGIYTPSLDLAYLGHRFRWEKDLGRSKEFATGKYADLPDGGKGWHGRTQVLVMVRDAEEKVNGPIMLTFRGWAGTYFLQAVDEHEAAVKRVF